MPTLRRPGFPKARAGILSPVTLGLALLAATGCHVSIDPGNPPNPTAARFDATDPVLNQRRVFVVGTITSFSAAETIRQLLYLDAQNQQPIDLFLMSPGGDLKAAFGIEHVFRLIKSRVNTWALGECNSGGALLLAAGTGERVAFRDSQIVLHGIQPMNHPPARYTELTQESYTDFWRRHAHLPADWLPIPQGHLHVLSAPQALDYGVIDRIAQ